MNSPVFFDFVGVIEEYYDSEGSETATVSDSSSSSSDSSSELELLSDKTDHPLQRYIITNSLIVRKRRTGEREQQQRTDDLSRQGQITIVDTVPVTNHAHRNRTHPPRTALFPSHTLCGAQADESTASTRLRVPNSPTKANMRPSPCNSGGI